MPVDSKVGSYTFILCRLPSLGERKSVYSTCVVRTYARPGESRRASLGNMLNSNVR